jgi:hypothetical protein
VSTLPEDPPAPHAAAFPRPVHSFCGESYRFSTTLAHVFRHQTWTFPPTTAGFSTSSAAFSTVNAQASTVRLTVDPRTLHRLFRYVSTDLSTADPQ